MPSEGGNDIQIMLPALKWLETPSWPWWYWLISGFLLFAVSELIVAWRSYHPSVPLAESWHVMLPRFFANLLFAFKGHDLITKGYTKFRQSPFQVLRGDGPMLVLPQTLLHELTSLPLSVSNNQRALEHDLLGHYTGLDLILRTRLHHSIVQRKLTSRLDLILPDLYEEVKDALDECLPEGKQWTETMAYRALARVSARLSAKALVGSELCRNQEWLDISVNFTERLFRTIVVMRLLPPLLHPVIFWLLPSYWKGRQYLRGAKFILRPHIEALLKDSSSPADKVDPELALDNKSVIAWLADTAKGEARDADVLAHVTVLLALASIHTTLLRMVNVLYDLIANPSLMNEIRQEISSAQGEETSKHLAISRPLVGDVKLPKLDSVLRESQRISPPTILGIKRYFTEAHTFSTGLHVPANTYVCLPTFAIENDALNTSDPSRFDGLRSYRQLQQSVLDSTGDDSTKEHGRKMHFQDHHAFTAAWEASSLNFGFGKTACPGRFFASTALKTVFIQLLQGYDFRFIGGARRPRNFIVHEFLFPQPWSRIEIRRREAWK